MRITKAQLAELEWIRQHYNERMALLDKDDNIRWNKVRARPRIQSVNKMLDELLKDYWLDEGYCRWDSKLLSKYKRNWDNDWEIGDTSPVL